MEGGIFLLLGSNQGDRFKNLAEARDRIGIKSASGIYVTAAWGKTDQDDFFNQAIEIGTALSPRKLLEHILAIEKEMGRRRLEKWGPRIIDIDILFYKDVIVDTESLTIPHPEIQNRRFALQPMNDLSPQLIHPVLKKTIKQLLDECPDPLAVTRLPHQP